MQAFYVKQNRVLFIFLLLKKTQRICGNENLFSGASCFP